MTLKSPLALVSRLPDTVKISFLILPDFMLSFVLPTTISDPGSCDPDLQFTLPVYCGSMSIALATNSSISLASHLLC